MADPVIKRGDGGRTADLTVPLRLARVHASRLPDPRAYVDCVVVVNDPASSDRPALALSDGSEWTVYGHSVREIIVKDVTPAQPAIPAVPQISGIPGAPGDDGRVSQLAQVILEMHDVVQGYEARLAAAEQRNADLERRIAFVEQHGLARAELVRA